MILYSACYENAITLGNSEARQQRKPRLNNTGSLRFENSGIDRRCWCVGDKKGPSWGKKGGESP